MITLAKATDSTQIRRCDENEVGNALWRMGVHERDAEVYAEMLTANDPIALTHVFSILAGRGRARV